MGQKGIAMKLLLTTIKTDCSYTDYSLRYLYSVLAESPLEVEMRTYDANMPEGRIYEDIIKGQYDIVYFHCNELNAFRIGNVIEMVKKAVPSTAAVAGGPQVSFETKAYMKANPWVDYVIRGEGEVVLYNFIKSVYSYEFDFENIPGLAYRTEDDIIVNCFDEPVELEDLPFPYEKTEADGSVIYYESMRGNADETTYNAHIPGAAVRSFSINRICRELRYFLVKEPEKVVFFDRSFNYDAARAFRIFEYLINNDNGVTSFEFNIDGEKLDEETVRLLGEAREGLFIFNIDVASTNSEVLAACGRKEDIYQLMYNVTKLLQAGTVRTKISITAGLPYETRELFARSFNKAYGLADGSPVEIRTLRLAKGTELRSNSEKYGYLYTSASPYYVISNYDMSAADLIRIRQIARVVKTFIGDGSFSTSIPRILTDMGLKPYDFFSGLNDYMIRHRLDESLEDKSQLARILFSYVHDAYDEYEESQKYELFTGAVFEDIGSDETEHMDFGSIVKDEQPDVSAEEEGRFDAFDGDHQEDYTEEDQTEKDPEPAV